MITGDARTPWAVCGMGKPPNVMIDTDTHSGLGVAGEDNNSVNSEVSGPLRPGTSEPKLGPSGVGLGRMQEICKSADTKVLQER